MNGIWTLCVLICGASSTLEGERIVRGFLQLHWFGVPIDLVHHCGHIVPIAKDHSLFSLPYVLRHQIFIVFVVWSWDQSHLHPFATWDVLDCIFVDLAEINLKCYFFAISHVFNSLK